MRVLWGHREPPTLPAENTYLAIQIARRIASLRSDRLQVDDAGIVGFQFRLIRYDRAQNPRGS